MANVQPDIQEIFCAALDLPSADEVAKFLDAACGGDANLRGQVEALLDSHRQAGDFLGGTSSSDPDTTDRPVTESVGSKIGRYKLLEQIGEGGMGVVFVAEQTEPVRRRVALKIVKPGMDTRQVIARFEAERQALAMMDHPNIAKVLDGGTTEAGRPYFVMELVRGMPITDYCDKAKLAPRQRLELFTTVCGAVQHAHQKGIIHRDLKPSNILVTLHDGTPVVKVIDFGVAKAIGHQLTEHTVYTALTQLVGTPLYMSPEQAELSGLDVDTRSDVYSLGVLLYEFLTGHTPFDRETLAKAGLDEIRRMIREDEPPRPSQRVSTLGAQAVSTVSHNRGLDDRRLTKLLRGELDWIVMNALEKDRNRRYESAAALAADIQRYLHDEPVQACPPSAAYRFGKFARKHRPAIVTTGLVAGALVVGIAVSTWQAIRATRAESLATANAEQAEANFKSACDAVSQMLTRVAEEKLNLPILNPVRTELGNKAISFYETLAPERQADPGLRQDAAMAYQTVGRMRQDIGDSTQAIELLGRSAAIDEQLIAEFPEIRPYARLARTRRYQSMAFESAGRNEEAESAMRAALKWALKIPIIEGQHRPAEDIICLGRLGDFLLRSGRLSEAETLIRQSLEKASAWNKDQPDDNGSLSSLAKCRAGLAALLMKLGQVREAETLFREAMDGAEIAVKRMPNDNPVMQTFTEANSGYSQILEREDRLAELEVVQRKGIEICESYATRMPSVPWRVAVAMRRLSLSDTLERVGRLDEANAQRLEARATFERLLAAFPDSGLAANSRLELQNNLAWSLATIPDPKYRDAARAVELARKATEASPKEGTLCNTLGIAYYRAGDWLAAIKALQKSEDLSPGWAFSFNAFFLAMAHWQLGHHDEARKWYDQAVEWLEKNQPQNAELIRFRAEAAELMGVEDKATSAEQPK